MKNRNTYATEDERVGRFSARGKTESRLYGFVFPAALFSLVDGLVDPLMSGVLLVALFASIAGVAFVGGWVGYLASGMVWELVQTSRTAWKRAMRPRVKPNTKTATAAAP